MLAYTPRHGLPSRSFTRIVALATPCCDTLRTYYHRLGFVGPFVPIHTNPWTPTTYIYITYYVVALADIIAVELTVAHG